MPHITEPPPYQPAWEAIVCRGCGRRLYGNDGTPIKPSWWLRFLGC